MLRVYVLVSFLFVCVFMSKFVLDEELFFLWKMRSEREGNRRGNMYSFGSSSSGVSQNVFLVLRGKGIRERTDNRRTLRERVLNVTLSLIWLYNIDSFCLLNNFAILRIFVLTTDLVEFFIFSDNFSIYFK